MSSGYVEILFTFVFVLLGSVTFHISALVSGVSIFRDMPSHLSTLMALSLGIILYGASPISFLTLGPYLGGSLSILAEQLPTPLSTAADLTQYLVRQRELLHNFIVHVIRFDTVMPYLLSAGGLGLMVGSLVRLHSRAKFLGWVQYATRTLFGIPTYELSWDAFLSSLKEGGEIRVHLKNEIIRGDLKHFSIRNEPQAIWLNNYSWEKRDSNSGEETSLGNGEILIRTEDIRKISAPSYSFHKHHDCMRHLSQGFYLTVSAIGALFLSLSCQGTVRFLLQKEYVGIFDPIRYGYASLGIAFLLIALLLLALGAKTVRQDCETWIGALSVYPEYYAISAVLAYAFCLLSREMIAKNYPFVGVYNYLPIHLFGAGLLAFVLWLRQRRGLLTEIYEKLLNAIGQDAELNTYLDEVYKKTELNEPDLRRRNELLKSHIGERNREHWDNSGINEELAVLLRKRPYLRFELYGLLLRFRLYKRVKEGIEIR